MSHEIIIESELYERLENHAEGFDTPANVIEKLLNHFDSCSNTHPIEPASRTEKRKKDTTKYSFNGHSYGKGKLVLAIVKDHVSRHPNVSFDDLRTVFPRDLQGSIGVINKYDFVQKNYMNKPHKRHFVKSDELIQLSDCTIAVCTEWGVGNINNIIEQGVAIGCNISAEDE